MVQSVGRERSIHLRRSEWVVVVNMAQYLVKQRNGYYATIEVPKNLRGKLGKVRFKQSLQTDSLKVAEVRKHALVSRWKAEIEAARNNLSETDLAFLVKVQKDSRKKDDPPKLTTEMIQHIMNVVGPASALSDTEKTEIDEIAKGKTVLLKQFITEYDKSLTYIEEKTKDIRISDVKRFAKQFKYAKDATKKAVRDWVEINLIAEQGLSLLSCRKIVSNSRQYWKYLQDKKDLNLPDPFDDVVPARLTTQKKINAESRKHFEVDDYKKLIAATKDPQMVALIQLAAYTGCRLEEICSLKTSDVKKDRLVIQDAKTKSGLRTIPIHKDIASLVASLVKGSVDGYVLSGLTENKYGDRSNAIGKRFGRIKTNCGYGPDLVFHSFRKSVASQFEASGIDELIAARLLGHKITTMSYGRYSSGNTPFPKLQEAINALDWN